MFKGLFFSLLFVVSQSVFAGFKISSYNIRNFDKAGQGTDKVLLAEIINDLKSDIIAVQEIYNDSSFKKFVKKYLPQYQLTLSKCGGGGRQNIGFLYNPKLVELKNTFEDTRLSSTDGIIPNIGCGSLRPAYLGFFNHKLSNRDIVAVVVHLKAGSGNRNFAKRWHQYKVLKSMIRELRLADHKNIILLGDFNTTGYSPKNADYKEFKKLLDSSGTSTIVDDGIKCTSYWMGRNRTDDIEEASILDHILYSNDLLKSLSLESVSVDAHCRVAKCENVYESILGESYDSVSDHCPLSATFR